MEVPRHWRLKKQRYAMVGEICPNCKAPVFPPRAVCPYCGGDAAAGTKAGYAIGEQQAAITLDQPVSASSH